MYCTYGHELSNGVSTNFPLNGKEEETNYTTCTGEFNLMFSTYNVTLVHAVIPMKTRAFTPYKSQTSKYSVFFFGKALYQHKAKKPTS